MRTVARRVASGGLLAVVLVLGCRGGHRQDACPDGCQFVCVRRPPAEPGSPPDPPAPAPVPAGKGQPTAKAPAHLSSLVTEGALGPPRGQPTTRETPPAAPPARAIAPPQPVRTIVPAAPKPALPPAPLQEATPLAPAPMAQDGVIRLPPTTIIVPPPASSGPEEVVHPPVGPTRPVERLPAVSAKSANPEPLAVPPAPLAGSGHAPDYSWLQGEVQQSLHGPRLRYAAIDQVDRFGGSVTLVRDGRVDALRDGQKVRVRGQLVNPNTDTPAPAYRVLAVEVLGR